MMEMINFAPRLQPLAAQHGETFGCITCLNGMPRTCSVASTACSEVQVLKLAQLDEILESASSDIAVDMLSFGNVAWNQTHHFPCLLNLILRWCYLLRVSLHIDWWCTDKIFMRLQNLVQSTISSSQLLGIQWMIWRQPRQYRSLRCRRLQ